MQKLETALYLDGILEMMGWSRATYFRRAPELEACRAIFYQWEVAVNRNGKRHVVRRIRAWPSRLKRWSAIKTAKEKGG